jgi:hypothetical protein
MAFVPLDEAGDDAYIEETGNKALIKKRRIEK